MENGAKRDLGALRKRRALLVYGAFVLALYTWVGFVALPDAGHVKVWGYDFAPRDGGWYVTRVDPSGPAGASLVPGDRIVAVDGDARIRDGCVWARTDEIAPGEPYTLTIERDGVERDATLSMTVRTGDARAHDAFLFYAVGLTFLLVGLFVAAFSQGTDAARLMCVTWITLAFGLLSQTLALERDTLGAAEIALGVVAFPVVLAALCLGYTFASRFPWGVRRSRFWTGVAYALYAWAAAVGVALVTHSLVRISGEPVRGPFSLAYPTFFAATNLGFQTFVAAVGLGMCAVSVRNLFQAREPGQRRRAKWLIYGTIAGVAPFTIVQTITSLAPALRIVDRLTLPATAMLVLLPVLVAYGIATGRLFDVEVVVRRGIKYLLARGLLRVVVLAQCGALVYEVAAHLDLTIREVLDDEAWLIALLAVTAVSLRFQRPLGEWIDRRFFREAWDREHILGDLAAELERVDAIGDCARLALARIDATLHPKTARVLFRAVSGIGFESWPEGEPATPPAEPDTDGGLLVPMIGAGGESVGVLVLGEKRSEQPYSATDQLLLTDVAARMAAAWERFRLMQQLEIEYRNSRESLERKREAEEAERRARYENEAKSVFLASMSHELRTPLNAVLGFAQLMRRDASLGAENREHLETILRSGEHLLGLINDVLSISKIEAGRVTLSTAVFDFGRLVQAVEEMTRVRATAKGVDFAVERAPGLPAAVLGDEGKLRQVLINLLGNAVKFTEAGRVTLRVYWSEGHARFDVEDTGCGIAPEEMGKLFVPFVQTESGRNANEGTGLGLVISREMVRLMGGDVHVSSEVGRGTTFRFDVELPSVAGEGPASERRMAVGIELAGHGRRVLVVDDTRENRVFLAKLLRAVRLEVREASNGAEAVDVWSEWRPHLIWMDQRMSVMDGRAATCDTKSRRIGANGAKTLGTRTAPEGSRTQGAV
jgi:signal transduction histidine kinase